MRRIFAGLLLVTLGCSPAEPDPPRNVLLISVDTLRRDHLGTYGYERDTSPRLDEFATGAVVFDGLMSSCSWTLPAHASMLTGLYPAHHGLQDDGTELDPEVPTLAEAFRDRGYHTFGVVSQLYVSRSFGLDRGFSDFDDSLIEDGRTNPIAEVVVDRFLERLDDAPPGQNWFAFLHFFDPHWDYSPPPPFADKFLDPAYNGRVNGTLSSLRPFFDPGVPMPTADHQAMVARYDGEIAYLDSQFGRLLTALGDRGVLDDLVIAITSDHGEEFKEHGLLGHGRTMFGEQLRVPLIIRAPGTKAGRRENLVSTTDLAPTLLGRAGVNPTFDMPGRDLLAGALDPNRVVFAESIRFGRELRAVRRGPHKAIHSQHGDAWLYFDVDRDPGEERPLANDPTGGDLREALVEYGALADRGWHLKILALREKRLRIRFVLETAGRLFGARMYFSENLSRSRATVHGFDLSEDGRELVVDATVTRHTGEIVFRVDPPDAPVTLRMETETPMFLGVEATGEDEIVLETADPRLVDRPADYIGAMAGVYVRYVPDAGGARVELPPEAIERLRALGYVE